VEGKYRENEGKRDLGLLDFCRQEELEKGERKKAHQEDEFKKRRVAPRGGERKFGGGRCKKRKKREQASLRCGRGDLRG